MKSWHRYNPTFLDPLWGVILDRGHYRGALHFTEVWFGAPGLRKFDIVIEGLRVREDYEPFAAGFATAKQEIFENTLEDELLEIDLVPKVENPMVSAIEIERIG